MDSKLRKKAPLSRLVKRSLTEFEVERALRIGVASCVLDDADELAPNMHLLISNSERSAILAYRPEEWRATSRCRRAKDIWEVREPGGRSFEVEVAPWEESDGLFACVDVNGVLTVRPLSSLFCSLSPSVSLSVKTHYSIRERIDLCSIV